MKTKSVTREDLAVLRENYQTTLLLGASDKMLARLRREYEDAVLTYKMARKERTA